MFGFPLPGSPVALIFQLLWPNYGLLVGKVLGETWLLGDPRKAIATSICGSLAGIGAGPAEACGILPGL